MTGVLESPAPAIGATESTEGIEGAASTENFVFSGRHAIAELEGVAASLLDDERMLREILTSALSRAGATVLEVTSQQFAPQGVTVLALLSESHASLHTYPEIGSAFMDVFTCGNRADPEHAVQLVAAALQTPDVSMTTIPRGLAQ